MGVFFTGVVHVYLGSRTRIIKHQVAPSKEPNLIKSIKLQELNTSQVLYPNIIFILLQSLSLR